MWIALTKENNTPFILNAEHVVEVHESKTDAGGNVRIVTSVREINAKGRQALRTYRARETLLEVLKKLSVAD